jgi:hypothetical protein
VPAANPLEPAAPRLAARGKDLSAFRTVDVVRVLLCTVDAGPRIEELTLEYLDKADRVRLQIEALREILGPAFRMKEYPPVLNRPELALWGHASACVIARRHERGGYTSLSDLEVARALEDFGRHRELYFL